MQPLSFLSLNSQGHKNCIGILVVNKNLRKKDYNQYAWQRLIWCPGSEGTSAKLMPIISQGQALHFSRMDGPAPASTRAKCKASVMDDNKEIITPKTGVLCSLSPPLSVLNAEIHSHPSFLKMPTFKALPFWVLAAKASDTMRKLTMPG